MLHFVAMKEEETKKRDYLLPGSILVAGIMISGSIIYLVSSQNSQPSGVAAEVRGSLDQQEERVGVATIRPVDKRRDHIMGSVDAPIMVVEYSDLECPFCKRFHSVMEEVVSAYNGKVAWVYRHFPLDVLHSKARKEAEASECAAELGGNVKFWEYVGRLFEVTPSNNGLDLSLLPQIAADVGLSRVKFESCLESGKYAARVAEDLEDATNAGGRGTPYSVVLVHGKPRGSIPGALPFSQVKAILDQALSEGGI